MRNATMAAMVALALALALGGAATTAHAESYQGGTGWCVTFDGDEMESNFDGSALADGFPSEFQPGDDATFSITLENGSGLDTDWYMTNETLATLEESNEAASGGNYTYRLTYTDAAGERRAIYDSEDVGGEKDAKAGTGLREATDALGDYLYLGRLGSGERGKVSLYVKVDGETMGNDYQDTLARLQMNFAVEKAAGTETAGTAGSQTDGTEAAGDQDGTTQASGEPQASDMAAQTGDDRDVPPWALLSLASGLLLLALAVNDHRKKKGGRTP